MRKRNFLFLIIILLVCLILDESEIFWALLKKVGYVLLLPYVMVSRYLLKYGVRFDIFWQLEPKDILLPPSEVYPFPGTEDFLEKEDTVRKDLLILLKPQALPRTCLVKPKEERIQRK